MERGPRRYGKLELVMPFTEDHIIINEWDILYTDYVHASTIIMFKKQWTNLLEFNDAGVHII